MGAGRPLAPKVLADEWAASGYFDAGTASQLAEEYVQNVQDAFIAIDGFRPLFEAGAVAATAEYAREIERGMRTQEEREIAFAYYDASEAYVQAALHRLGGNEIAAMQAAYHAESLVEKTELNGDWRILEKFQGVRARFKELVQERYDESDAACDSEAPEAAECFKALNQGVRDLRELVLLRSQL